MQKLAVPFAVVFAGALIAGAVYFTRPGSSSPTDTPTPVAQEIRGIQKDDHVRGNPNAKVVIVEYSDTECPFCKNFQETLKRVVAEYGASGEVAWVYRNFPLVQLHPKAPKEAEAIECAAELGGNEVFWKYLDRLFEVTPSNNGLDLAQLPVIAEYVGLDKTKFTTCLESGKYKVKIDKETNEAIAAGGQGTPHSIILFAGEQIPIEGGQPFEVVKSMIDTLISDKE